jgi:hypothetical protein
MKQIELKDFSAGNFAASITIEPSEEVYDFFAREGATRFFQNGVLPRWEKEEAVRLGLWPLNAKGNPERPKTGYKRENIGFSEEGKQALFKLISDAETPVNGKKTSVGVVDVEVRENSDYSSIIAILENWLAANNKDGSRRTLEQFCAKAGVTVPNEPWQDDNGFLAQVSAWYAQMEF